MNDSLEDRPQIQAAIQSLQLRAWSCAMTMRIAQITGDRETSFNTASGVLIEFPNRAIIGTAWHVLEQFRELRASGKTVALVCDNMPILTPRIAFSDEAADIAFIEVPSTGQSGIHAAPYRPGRCWPPPSVQQGDAVLLCGFPKLLRQDAEEILHGDLNLLLEVKSASEKHFMLQLEWERLVQAGRVIIPPGEVDYGGTSGGPVFLYDGGCNPLVGLVTQAGDTLPLWRIAALSGVPEDIQSRPTRPL